jgi:valyl-tRNA synthetase
MPFVTEEIWRKLDGLERSIMIAPYPIVEEVLEDPDAERMVSAVKAMITSVRNARAERSFTPKDRFKLYIEASDTREANFFKSYEYLLIEQARLTDVIVNGTPPGGTHQDVIEGFAIAIEFPKRVITSEQIERTQREIEKVQKEIASTEARLANEQFVKNAPHAVVEGARTRLVELRQRLEKLQKNR